MEISWRAFACLFGDALFGMPVRRILPEHHLTADSKDVVKLGMGPDCDHVRPRPRPADRVGKGFLRYAENRGLSCPIACNSIVFWLTTEGKGATLTTGRASCDGDGYSMAYP
jgi:hypothetical protein